MTRGILWGTLWAGLIAAAILIVANEMGRPVDLSLPAPRAEPVEVPAGSEFSRARPDETPVIPGTEARPAGDTAPAVATPVPDAAPTAADVAPERVAAPDQIADRLATPAEPTPAAEAPDGEDIVLPTPETVPPREPAADTAPAPAAALVQPAAGGAETVAEAPEAPEVPEVPAETLAATPAADSALPELSSAAQPADPSQDAQISPQAPAAAPAAETETVAMQEPAAGSDAPPVAGPEAPQGLQFSLPQIEAPQTDETAEELPQIGAAADPVIPPDAPAITAHRMPFEGAAGAPLMSVILIDPGPGRPDQAGLADFPLPLSIAVDPTLPDAEETMDAYRAAGHEVLVLTPLPEGATPADVEVAFQSYFAAVPRAVAVMDMPAAVLQEGRPRAAQVAVILAETGHGLVSYEAGLNTGLQLASREGVRAAAVFRRFDGPGRNKAAMKRFLDGGAFRAGQEGGAIVVGEHSEAALEALAEWRLGTRAATVALVPISALLLGN